MRSVEEHRAAVLDLVGSGRPAQVPLSEALGLVVCEDVSSGIDLPGFDNSAMDGYAVRRDDLVRASGPDGVELRVVDALAAGADAAGVVVAAGTAVKIMTGAPVPVGADCIIPVEVTRASGSTVVIDADAAARADPGQHVRPRGEDVRAGTCVLTAGALLDARRLGLLAAIGRAQAPAYARPRVAIVSTGAELVPPGQPLDAGQLYDANSFLLQAALTQAGAHATRYSAVTDDEALLLAALDRAAADNDLLVTSGGVSMGDHDVVKSALRDRGVDFVQVAMQPGKPQGLGRVGGVPILALPGNPVSAYVSFEVFVRPALRQLMGLDPGPLLRTGRWTSGLASPRGRRQYARALAGKGPAGWELTPLRGQGSHFVADLAHANALAVIPESVTQVAAGEPVDFLLLGGEMGGGHG